MQCVTNINTHTFNSINIRKNYLIKNKLKPAPTFIEGPLAEKHLFQDGAMPVKIALCQQVRKAFSK